MPPALRTGDLVGSGRAPGWQVERKIGEGQFAEVYQVTDMQTREQVRLGAAPQAAAAAGDGERRAASKRQAAVPACCMRASCTCRAAA